MSIQPHACVQTFNQQSNDLSFSLFFFLTGVNIQSHVYKFYYFYIFGWFPTCSLVQCNTDGSRLVIEFYSIISFLNSHNFAPISRYVKLSTNIKCDGKYSTFTSPLSILIFKIKVNINILRFLSTWIPSIYFHDNHTFLVKKNCNFLYFTSLLLHKHP